MLQVSLDVPERRQDSLRLPRQASRSRAGVEGVPEAPRRRPARHESRQVHPQVQPRRAAADLQCHQGRDEPRRPAPVPAARKREDRQLPARHLHDHARHHRPLAGQRPQ